MFKLKSFSVIFIAFFLIACNGPKSLTKKGNKFSEAGIHDQAVNYYIKALDKKPTHVDAQVGLLNSGRAMLSEYTSKFFQAYSTGNHKTAVYAYIEMENFVKRVSRYTTKITIAQSYKDDFEDSKKIYVESKFDEANELISEEKFNAANVIFQEIEKIEPNFEGQDFEALKEMALLEPYYRRGTKHLNNDKYRRAYAQFKFIDKKNTNYKDSKFKLSDALESAQYTIGVLKFENLSDDKSASEYISSQLTDNIIKSGNPFVKLIDRSNMDRIVKEQMMNMNGVTNGSVAIKAGALVGAKALLVGTVLKVTKKHQSPKAKKVKAYSSYQVKKYDAEKDRNYYETKYKKTSYYQYDGYNKITISFKYQLISTETGQILLSDIIEKTANSKVSYATYSGNHKNLVPGDWKHLNSASTSDKVNTKSSARRSLRNKLSANKKLISLADIQSNIQTQVAKQAAVAILKFNPED
ncbi:MAG: hypothetical protein ACJA0Q_000807 [Saprospiraceae bacterium]|jgi:hypothetical protein